jgi:heme/copper-type cytochrome/quinol oxidase subunit 4
MKGMLGFGAALVLIVLAGGTLLTIAFSSPDERRAVVTSAGVVVVVQLVAFAFVRFARPDSLGGWLAGTALRFVAVIAYAIVAVKVAGLPPAAGLLSLVMLLFVSTLIEPKFLTI